MRSVLAVLSLVLGACCCMRPGPGPAVGYVELYVTSDPPGAEIEVLPGGWSGGEAPVAFYVERAAGEQVVLSLELQGHQTEHRVVHMERWWPSREQAADHSIPVHVAMSTCR